MHFRVSKNGVMTDEDVYHQPDAVYEYIKPGDVVVELGYGQGSNLLYRSDKEKVFREINRILKPGGVMIVYDYALKEPFETFDYYVQTVISLISKGGACSMIESLEDMNTHFTNSGLTLEKVTDYTLNLLPVCSSDLNEKRIRSCHGLG